MKSLYRTILLLACIFAFAKCNNSIEKLQDKRLRHIQRNTIVSEKGSVPLAYYEETEATIIYLVRHAEKKSDGSKNPELSDEGIQRATQLMKILQETTLDAIYSTPYTRTTMTVEPIAQLKNQAVLNYDPRKLAEFAERLKNMKGKRVLVSGHSNTTPTLVNLLIGNQVYKQIDESDYGNFFVVCLSPTAETKIVKLRY